MMAFRLWSTNRLMCDDSLSVTIDSLLIVYDSRSITRSNIIGYTIDYKYSWHSEHYFVPITNHNAISRYPTMPSRFEYKAHKSFSTILTNRNLFKARPPDPEVVWDPSIHPWWIRILSSERTRTPMAFTWYWGFRQLPGVCVGRLIINHQLKLYLVYFSSLRLNLNYGRMCVQAVQVLYVEKGTLWLMFILYQFNSTIHAVIIQSWYNTMFIILSIYARPAGIMLKGRILVLGVRDS